MDDLEIIKLYCERNERAIDVTDKKYGRLLYSISLIYYPITKIAWSV